MARTWFAIEEHAEDQDVTLMEVPSESLEAEMVEVEGEDKDIEALTQDGEDLGADIDTVEDLTDNAEASLEEDGMDETAARATEIAAESLCSKWGVKTRRGVGIESFGNPDSRRQATQIAVEDLKEKAKDMWRQFVAWCKEMIAKARDMFAKLYNAGKALRKRADKLDKRLGDGLGTMKKTDVSGSFLKQLVIDEKFDYEGCLKFADTSATDVGKAAKVVDAVYGSSKELFRGETKSGVISMDNPFSKKTGKKIGVPQGANDISISALPGNGFLSFYTKDGVQYGRFDQAPMRELKKAPTLNQDKCSSGVKALYKIAETLETRLKGFETANQALSKLVESMDKAADAYNESKGEERSKKREAFTQARAIVQAAKATERASTFALKTAGSGIQGYIGASIGAHDKA